MDKEDARGLLRKRLAEYRKLSYSALVAKLGEVESQELSGSSGVDYQIEIQFVWDDKPNGDVRLTTVAGEPSSRFVTLSSLRRMAGLLGSEAVRSD